MLFPQEYPDHKTSCNQFDEDPKQYCVVVIINDTICGVHVHVTLSISHTDLWAYTNNTASLWIIEWHIIRTAKSNDWVDFSVDLY